MSVLNTARVVVALQSRPQSIATLSKETGLSKNTTQRLIALLRDHGFIEFNGLDKPREFGGVTASLYRWKQ
jgi:DNA-binding IclR family transcriptional regulator